MKRQGLAVKKKDPHLHMTNFGEGGRDVEEQESVGKRGFIDSSKDFRRVTWRRGVNRR